MTEHNLQTNDKKVNQLMQVISRAKKYSSEGGNMDDDDHDMNLDFRIHLQ